MPRILAPAIPVTAFCHVRHSASVALTTNDWTVQPFDTEVSDTLDMHSTSANPERVTIPYAGLYWVKFAFSLGGIASGNRVVRLRKNAGAELTRMSDGHTDGKGFDDSLDVVASFVAGDYVTVEIFNSAAGNSSAQSAGVVPALSVVKFP